LRYVLKKEITNLLLLFSAKNGVEPDQCTKLVKFVIDNCPRLNFIGLMTIGAIEPENDEPNRDFQVCSGLLCILYFVYFVFL